MPTARPTIMHKESLACKFQACNPNDDEKGEEQAQARSLVSKEEDTQPQKRRLSANKPIPSPLHHGTEDALEQLGIASTPLVNRLLQSLHGHLLRSNL